MNAEAQRSPAITSVVRIVVAAVLVQACLFAAAPSASAQDEPQSSFKETLGTAVLRSLYGATPVIQEFDATTTLKVLDLGGRETNPLLNALGSNHHTLFLVFKGGMAAAEVLGAHSLAAHHKFLAIAVLIGVNTAYAVVAAHNVQNAQTLRSQGTLTLP